MAIKASFSPSAGLLSVSGDNVDNTGARVVYFGRIKRRRSGRPMPREVLRRAQA